MKNTLFPLIALVMLFSCKKEKDTPPDIRDQFVSENYEGSFGLTRPQDTVSLYAKLRLRKNSDHAERIDVVDYNANTIVFYIDQIEQSDTVFTFRIPSQVQGGEKLEGTKLFTYGNKVHMDGFCVSGKHLKTWIKRYDRTSGLEDGYYTIDVTRP